MTAQTFDQLPVGAHFRFADTEFDARKVYRKIADYQAYWLFADDDDVVMNADDLVVLVRETT